MRLFIAARLPQALCASVHRMACDAALGPAVRWLPPASLHVTLFFIGDFPMERLAECGGACAQVAACGSKMRLRLAGGGVFPHARRPTVFWAGLQGDTERLCALARGLREALVPLGASHERRDFRAHLTIGRAATGAAGGALLRAGDQFC